MNGWLNVKTGAAYAGVSERTFSKWLRDGLKHIRVSARIIKIKPEWIDEYIMGFADSEAESESIVNKIMSELRITG